MSTSIDHIAAANKEEAKTYGDKVKNNSDDTGFIGIYRYQTTKNSTGTLCIFVDCEKELGSLQTTMLTSLAMSAGGLLMVFLLVCLFSHMIFRPVEESDIKQKQFITDAGHELKTPLTIIQANVDVLEIEHGESSWSKSIKNQVERLSSMVKQLITLAKMDEGNVKLEKKSFCLSDILFEAIESFAPLAQSRDKTFQVDIEESLSFYGDQEAIKQLFGLLLDNAIKYTLPEGIIEISLHQKNKHLFFTIKNPCDGLSQGNQDILFERFYRGDSSRNSETGGTGIGLSIAKALAKSSQLKIHAENKDGSHLAIQIIF